MKEKILKAGVISVGALLLTQLIRFAGNILLAKLLAPSAFGVVAIVNLTLLGINLLSDLGIRQVIIQKQGTITQEFLNTIWVVQIARGVGICVVASLVACGLWALQHGGWVIGNVYADPLLPFLIVGAATSAVFYGLESTKSITERRELNLGRVTAISLLSQLLAMGVMVLIAKMTASPWALIAGAITTALLQSVMSHTAISGAQNRWQFDWKIARSILGKSRWILVSSPLTFLGANAEVMILGGLISPDALGNYMIAFLLANVFHQVASNMASNVFFPALSAAGREGPAALQKTYLKFQLISDGVLVTAAGAAAAGGEAVVRLLFDQRYASAGVLLTYLAIGLVGLRYHVIEQLIYAQGNFRLGTVVTSVRLLLVSVGTYLGFLWAGLPGAAICIGLSWLGGWPVLLWFRAKTIPWPWKVEAAAVVFLAAGYGLGTLFTAGVHLLHR